LATVNRAQLRTLARVYANQRPAGANAFIVDSDATLNATSLDTIINLRLASLYDMLVAARGHEYYASDTAITTVPGTSTYSLAALTPPFYQLLDLRIEWDQQNIEPVQDTSVYERSNYQNWLQTWSRWSPKAYRLRGTQVASASTLELFPTPNVAVLMRARYVPAFVALADDTATFDSVNGWETLVALGAAIDMRMAADKDYAQIEKRYNQEFARIYGIADQRAANMPPRIVDVNPDSFIGEWVGDRRWI
jgi:hypothetical protein